jgi:nucleotide-binding universal stress UspA family protein
MLLRIFVPLDGSPLAEGALDMAALLARRMKNAQPTHEPTLILFRALDLALWLDIDMEQARTRAAETAAAYLQAEAQQLCREGLTVETVVRLGNPVDEILDQAIACQADLIIMTTHGRTGLARWTLGSVAERVARAASVPVLLIPTNTPALPSNQLEGERMRILVPLDGSSGSEAALPHAVALAQLCGAELRLLFVLVPRFEEWEPLRESRQAMCQWDGGHRRVRQIERYLMRKTREVNKAGVEARWAFGYGMPGPKIIEDAHLHHINLISMATHSHNQGSRRKLSGTVEEVVHRGHLPILVVQGIDASAESFQIMPESAEAPTH